MFTSRFGADLQAAKTSPSRVPSNVGGIPEVYDRYRIRPS